MPTADVSETGTTQSTANEQQQQQYIENKLMNAHASADKNDTIMQACSLCKNNATCMINDEAEELVCICPLGFSGYYCEQGKFCFRFY
jgi:hypothetical protein